MMLTRLRSQWFVLTLLTLLAVGTIWAQPLSPIVRMPWLKEAVVVTVLLCQSMTLRTEQIVSVATRPRAALIAIGVCTVAVPMVAAPICWWLDPADAGGVWVVTLVPCTLASAAVWTRRAGGNDAVALATTVFTNLCCFLVVPAGMSIGRTFLTLPPAVDTGGLQQTVRLLWLVVLPLIVGQIARRLAPAAVDRHRDRLTRVALGGILSTVLMAAVTAAMTGASSPTIASFIVLTVVCLAIHVASMFVGWSIATVAHCDRSDRIAVAIAGSQKTLIVGITVATSAGVAVLPMILYHTVQMIFDTLMADRWRLHDRCENPPPNEFSHQLNQ